MNEKTGEVFSIARDNEPVFGCTTSKAVYRHDAASIVYFSLAAHTDISPETYGYHKLIHVKAGALRVYASGGDTWELSEGDIILTPTGVPVGMDTQTGCVYTEVEVRKDSTMNEVLKDGEVFKLAELLPIQEGKVINMDLAHNDKMKFVLMSFDAGTGLSEHSAPGEAIIFCLEGEGIIGYEGTAYTIHAGENFKFAKNGRHYVKAEKPFKMALLMTLE